MNGEEAKRTKGERRRERPWRARTRVNIGGGGKEGTRTITDRNTNRNLNIGTESRVQIADALGKELQHPKMSKLWDSETGPTTTIRLCVPIFNQFFCFLFKLLLKYILKGSMRSTHSKPLQQDTCPDLYSTTESLKIR